MAHCDHEPAVEVARGWLTQCLEEHDSCKKRAELVSIWAIGSLHMVRDLDHDDRMPRCLLDLGSESQCSFIKLLDIGKTAEKIQYFALSHRVCASLGLFFPKLNNYLSYKTCCGNRSSIPYS
jgi:hypothetical protein